jgi:hypothetical protein
VEGLKNSSRDHSVKNWIVKELKIYTQHGLQCKDWASECLAVLKMLRNVSGRFEKTCPAEITV